MNREQRRHPSKKASVMQLLDDLSVANKFKDIIEGGWPVHDGDKVRINLDVIKSHPGYEKKLSTYRRFCEQNAGRIFTVGIDPDMHKSVAYLKEDPTQPKWLFWIGDLEKVTEEKA